MSEITKVVLAYSGGLDTSVILRWLQETYRCEVVTYTADLGQGEELEPARAKAESMGIKEIYIDDVREEFVRDFVFPMFRCNTLYEGEYLLGTSIARPLIAKRLVEVAAETGAEAMAHGAARTNEPIREGLVAMVGPIVDTLFICTCTAIIILLSGVWQSGDANGVTMTARAFEATIPHVGLIILVTCIFFFGVSTIFSYSYYGAKCLGFLIGAERQHYYNYAIVVMTVVAAMMSIDAMVNLIDLTFACMAIPTMVSALLLSRKVMTAANEYFAKIDAD